MNKKNSPFLLEGKVIIVTGASSGIGRQCAISCSRMGAVIALMGRNQERLMETLNSMDNQDNHVAYSLDLIDYDKVVEKVQELVNEKGKISGLINCAGISTTLPLNALSPEKMCLFFQTNVIGATNLTKQVVRPSNFSDSGGSIIFISSVMGVVGEKGKTLYSMTKGALIPAVRSMSLEFAARKVRINCISPGVVETAMSKNAVYSQDKDSLERIKSLHPLGLGSPEDVANACVFLLSDASRWITGTNLIVDGGYLAH